MWDFLDKLISAVLPQVKDFQGVSRSGFDGHGNYTLGLTEQIIFPELDYDTTGRIRGLQVTICCRPNRDEKAVRIMLEKLGMPFEKHENHDQNRTITNS
jgi:large subunit ribosomal protein L5